MSPTSCRCSTPRRGAAAPADRPAAPSVGGTRSGLASRGGAPAVLSGAAMGHDRVRDGSGWGHRALDHGSPRHPRRPQPPRTTTTTARHRPGALRPHPPTPPHPSTAPASPATHPPVLPGGNGTRAISTPPSAMSTARLRSVARRPPAASLPGRLPGASPGLRQWGASSWGGVPA